MHILEEATQEVSGASSKRSLKSANMSKQHSVHMFLNIFLVQTYS